jgi:tetratricopeptide (TPR) repeat protein
VDDEVEHPRPTRETDAESTQLFIGIRYLLLSPLFGYSLESLTFKGAQTTVRLRHDGEEEVYDLPGYRRRIRAHVHEELERASQGPKSAIDLSKVADAEIAAEKKDWAKVVQLLGSWPSPLAIFLRTPEGQMLAPDAKALIAKGLGLLGTACVELDEVDQAEEVFRIGIQYAHDGLPAADLYRRLGDALLVCDRPGEAIGPLRRAIAFGARSTDVMPSLGRAFLRRKRYVAAYACFKKALSEGVEERAMAAELAQVEAALGSSLTAWKARAVKRA